MNVSDVEAFYLFFQHAPLKNFQNLETNCKSLPWFAFCFLSCFSFASKHPVFEKKIFGKKRENAVIRRPGPGRWTATWRSVSGNRMHHRKAKHRRLLSGHQRANTTDTDTRLKSTRAHTQKQKARQTAKQTNRQTTHVKNDGQDTNIAVIINCREHCQLIHLVSHQPSATSKGQSSELNH